MATKRPDGIYPYIGTPIWGERLADAVENTCADLEVVPPPRQAITEGLATALPDTEIKNLISTQRGRKVLKPTAHRLVQAGADQVLLLMCDVHGAAVAPWHLNDRTVPAWSPPVPEANQRVEDLVAAEVALEEAQKAAKSAEKEVEACRRAPGDESYTAQALAAATQKHQEALRLVNDLEDRRQVLLAALGNRRPRPVVRSAEEEREPKAALVLAEQPYALAVHLQRYAAASLERAGRTRGYDLVESLVDAGQLSKGMNVLQQWQITNSDGTVSKPWRLAAVTGNNRALARLDVFRVRPEHLVTGMPQSLVSLPKEKADTGLLLLSLREILNRVSHRLNEGGAKSETLPTDPSLRAGKIATVSAEIVIGCSRPEALEHVLRTLNVNDHLRGIQPYDEDARLIALFATLVDSYARESVLAAALAEAFPNARGADLLDLAGVRDALTANGPLDPLEPLVSAGEEVSPVVLRDIAVRAITALVFPEIPPETTPKSSRRTVRDTGRFWPIVRGALQEPAWSQIRAKTAEARTRLWSAAVAQLFLHRGNILSALGFFGTPETQKGAVQDPRPLKELFLGAEAGDPTAWDALVQRMAPVLIHAPQPFITPGQGSEAGDRRKGVRRSPSSALAALTLAYTQNNVPGISRALLLAFAKAVLEHPDATQPPEAQDDTPLVCYGEQHWSERDRTPITAGMVIAPDIEGRLTGYVADKAWFDEMFPVELGRPAPAVGDGSTSMGAGNSAGASDGGTSREEVPVDPRDQLAALRQQLPARVELVEGSYQRAVDSAHTMMTDFEEARRLRAQLGEDPLPADQRIEWMEKLSKARDAARASVTSLDQVETLILQI
ncbi:hypothetical protein LZP81_17575 [Streptomyces parvulus]|uniref:hypothetical protein n=1 Tax=Streptomyces parvulus TaxID=146923 RepID=UPI001E3CB184|nr:hypothetical protein [Streptomyces parvulus]MCC9157085.1 hypothetical protein [Streptomyces parvulus]MCE7688649.1 hypothetical protein [Streptomyces parvulus]